MSKEIKEQIYRILDSLTMLKSNSISLESFQSYGGFVRLQANKSSVEARQSMKILLAAISLDKTLSAVTVLNESVNDCKVYEVYNKDNHRKRPQHKTK